MRVTKYYCDCCGLEVESNKDLNMMEIHNGFKVMQDEECPYTEYDLCKDCAYKIEIAKEKEFDKIKKEMKEKIEKFLGKDID